jgi:DNA-binding NarL/FixJ family response regulator
MKLILVDDDPIVCKSLKTILQATTTFEITAIGHSGDEAIALYEAHRPDLLLMDIRMEPKDGLTAGETILARHPQAKILFLTTFSDDDYIVKALRMGAKGFLLKQHVESIVPAIRAVLEGQSVFGSEIVSRIPELMSFQNPQTAMPTKALLNTNLTDRESDVLMQVAEGLSNKEIAEKLFLSEGTVRNYISTLLEKLDLRDRTQLAIWYWKK